MDTTPSQSGRRQAPSPHERAVPRSLAWQSRLWKQYRRWRKADAGADTERRPRASILLVTYDRLRMLEECVASVLANTGDVEYELIAWDNASSDGTADYLDAIAASHPQVRVFHHAENIGLNAVAASVRLSRGEYVLAIDDDVVRVPPGWLSEMIRAFEAVPRAGYLAANVVQDGFTNGSKPTADHYRARDYGDDVVVEHGPTGGWCTMTSRAVLKRIGNFREVPGRVFFLIDGDFAQRCARRLYRVGIVRNVKVYHAAGLALNKEYGYLELCRQKYAEDPEFEAFLAATVATIDDADGISG